MFVHIFTFRWKDEATPADKQRAEAAIRRFDGQIDGLVSLMLGENQSSKSAQFTMTGIMMFASHDAFERYVDHPLHAALLEWLVPLIDAFELDFESQDTP
ncbi:Dabb family protein [Sphingobium sp. HBC34]|uniref:Dabb family protein n=1 Tax=Sphingobium cyanobacteriorum TaxID=3063954 RepID=A0ABT8ZQ06_9SPHN|nr:Dabb family protein [Sphingobium sp. HBC34]MDO7836625.1 Dabb family protein [Sphingobium sp. HBC34]